MEKTGMKEEWNDVKNYKNSKNMQLRSCSAVDSSGPTSIQKQKQHKKNCVSKMSTEEPKAVIAEFNVPTSEPVAKTFNSKNFSK